MQVANCQCPCSVRPPRACHLLLSTQHNLRTGIGYGRCYDTEQSDISVRLTSTTNHTESIHPQQ